MFVVIVAIIVLLAAVGAIYLLLKSMGEDGVEVAAPGSCKRGRCGVRTPPAEGEGETAIAAPVAAESLPASEPSRERTS